MKILLTGAEVVRIGRYFAVLYKDRVLSKRMNKEQAIELAMNKQLLDKEIYGTSKRKH